MNIQKKHKGFTIIEVVLVLAIGGLILMMALIAYPALQRSTHDVQRKDSLSKVLKQLSDYTSNNRNSIPSSLVTASGGGGKSFVQNYLGGTSLNTAGSDYEDPQTGPYVFTAANATIPTTPVIGNIYFNTSAMCGTDGSISAGTTRQFAIRLFLEGQNTPYCVDNH